MGLLTTGVRSSSDMFRSSTSCSDVAQRYDQVRTHAQVSGEQMQAAGGGVVCDAPLSRLSGTPGERRRAAFTERYPVPGGRMGLRCPVRRGKPLSPWRPTHGGSRPSEPCLSWPGKRCGCPPSGGGRIGGMRRMQAYPLRVVESTSPHPGSSGGVGFLGRAPVRLRFGPSAERVAGLDPVRRGRRW